MICRLRHPVQNVSLAKLDKLPYKGDKAITHTQRQLESPKFCQDARLCSAPFSRRVRGIPAPSRRKLRQGQTLRKAFAILFVLPFPIPTLVLLLPHIIVAPTIFPFPLPPLPYSLVPPLNSCTAIVPTFLCPSSQHPQSLFARPYSRKMRIQCGQISS